MVDLDKLKDEINAVGEKIKSLKSAESVDQEAVGAAVKELLTLKKQYAENNDGIGVDGKPFEEPLTKAQKKAKAKAEKGGGGPDKPKAEPNSVNAQKKAAKKAAKKALKEEVKQGGGNAPVAQASAPEKQAPKQTTTPTVPSTAAVSTIGPGATTVGGLQPLQVAISPNVPLIERPVVALSVATLSNTWVDLELVSDHRRPHTALGTEEGSTVVGDFAMARYLARRAKSDVLMTECPSQAALVEGWVDYAASLTRFGLDQRIKAVAMTLEHALKHQTYLVGSRITLADLCLFAVVGFPTQAGDLESTLKALPERALAAKRFIRMMAQHPALQSATQLCLGIVNNEEGVFDESNVPEPLYPGMNILEGAVPGRIVTRFPPEPSGYLHIGHAKACLLNDYYATRYKGRLLLRFDDTNPSKEKEEFQEAIVADLAKLGVKPHVLSYTSDYFDVIEGYALYMIENGLAYMDDTPQEQMKAERAERQESKHRNQTKEDALKYFKLMCSGDSEGSQWCLRARIDMKSDNGTMRDPVLFRQNLTPHHRSGTKYKAYPTYDLACPIVDSIEGVTHALRTTEYNDRDEQYYWVIKALGLRQVFIHAFARMNFVNTVLSKRKLTWFVENGYVTGWDDARFPTVRGVVRRGINIAALRSFIYSQGASRRVVNMDWTVFWSENKKEIDKTAKRFMAIDKENHVVMKVTNAPAEGDFGYVETSFHPKDPSLGKRVVRISSEVLLEKVDVEGIELNEQIVLLRWGVIKVTKVGEQLEGEYVPGGDFKAPKRKISWLANVSLNIPVVLTEFDNLVTKDKLEEDDKFEDYINPHTMATTEVIGDAFLKTLNENDIIQLERRGYYRVDRPYVGPDKPLILFTIPDGKAKAMSGQSTKLAHH